MELAAKDLELSNELIIIRVSQNAYQCNGGFMIFDKEHNCVFSGKTLELPFLANQKQISSIPLGNYVCEKVVHQTFGKCFRVFNVPNREGIFVHVGNYHNQIRGCILLGSALIDINADGIVDVVNSRRTLDRAFTFLTKRFTLIIL